MQTRPRNSGSSVEIEGGNIYLKMCVEWERLWGGWFNRLCEKGVSGLIDCLQKRSGWVGGWVGNYEIAAVKEQYNLSSWWKSLSWLRTCEKSRLSLHVRGILCMHKESSVSSCGVETGGGLGIGLKVIFIVSKVKIQELLNFLRLSWLVLRKKC